MWHHPSDLGVRYPGVRVWGVELQEPLATLAAENVRANEMHPQVTVLHADLRDIGPDAFAGRWTGRFQPPLSRGRSGRVNPEPQRALARHEIAMTYPISLEPLDGC